MARCSQDGWLRSVINCVLELQGGYGDHLLSCRHAHVGGDPFVQVVAHKSGTLTEVGVLCQHPRLREPQSLEGRHVTHQRRDSCDVALEQPEAAVVTIDQDEPALETSDADE